MTIAMLLFQTTRRCLNRATARSFVHPVGLCGLLSTLNTKRQGVLLCVCDFIFASVVSVTLACNVSLYLYVHTSNGPVVFGLNLIKLQHKNNRFITPLATVE